MADGFDSKAGLVKARLMADFGWNDDQASGVLGNLGVESGLQGVSEAKPTVPGSLGGFGWAQWTGDRRKAFAKYASDNNFDPKSDDANYGYLRQDLLDNYPQVVKAVRAAPNRTAAASTFLSGYEGGPPASLPQRVALANRASAVPADSSQKDLLTRMREFEQEEETARGAPQGVPQAAPQGAAPAPAPAPAQAPAPAPGAVPAPALAPQPVPGSGVAGAPDPVNSESALEAGGKVAPWDLGQSITNALMLGQLPVIAGVGRTAADYLRTGTHGPDGIGADFMQNVASYKQAHTRFTDEHPVQSITGDVVGGVLPEGAVANKVASVLPTVAGPLGRFAAGVAGEASPAAWLTRATSRVAGGATRGAVSSGLGSGIEPNQGNGLQQAEEGAAGGAALGTLGQPLSYLARKVVGTAPEGAAALTAAMREAAPEVDPRLTQTTGGMVGLGDSMFNGSQNPAQLTAYRDALMEKLGAPGEKFNAAGIGVVKDAAGKQISEAAPKLRADATPGLMRALDDAERQAGDYTLPMEESERNQIRNMTGVVRNSLQGGQTSPSYVSTGPADPRVPPAVPPGVTQGGESTLDRIRGAILRTDALEASKPAMIPPGVKVPNPMTTAPPRPAFVPSGQTPLDLPPTPLTAQPGAVPDPRYNPGSIPGGHYVGLTSSGGPLGSVATKKDGYVGSVARSLRGEVDNALDQTARGMIAGTDSNASPEAVEAAQNLLQGRSRYFAGKQLETVAERGDTLHGLVNPQQVEPLLAAKGSSAFGKLDPDVQTMAQFGRYMATPDKPGPPGGLAVARAVSALTKGAGYSAFPLALAGHTDLGLMAGAGVLSAPMMASTVAKSILRSHGLEHLLTGGAPNLTEGISPYITGPATTGYNALQGP